MRKLTDNEKKIVMWEKANNIQSLCLWDSENTDSEFSPSGCDVLQGPACSTYLCIATTYDGDEFILDVRHEVLSYFANGLD